MSAEEDQDERAEWDSEGVAGLRYKLGLSQQEFAHRLGVRQQTVSEWETGLHTPRGASKRVLSMVAEEAAKYETATTPKRGGRRRKKPGASS